LIMDVAMKEGDLRKVNNAKRMESLGLFHVLDDSDIMDLLEFMDEKALLKLSLVSHLFYIFSDEEELVSESLLVFFRVLTYTDSIPFIVVENLVHSQMGQRQDRKFHFQGNMEANYFARKG
jgi:hypothetical protein